MAWSGVNKRILEELGGKAVCFISDEDVVEEARQKGTTRATASMDKAAAYRAPYLCLGNAPML